MGKRYKCPYCEKRDERKKLIDHIDKRHQEMLPDGYDGARVMYDKINHTDGHGICRVCKKDTPWNPKAQRYDVLCGNPKCKEAMREEYKKNVLRGRGTYNILNDPQQQEKMLANRSISGKYKFQDGGVVTYTGSYEKKFLEFIDNVMEIPSKDIMMPGPTIEYWYKGEKHFYITDCLYIPFNAIIEIKDGGNNPNNKSTPGMIASREKTIQKEKLITDRGEYNYIRLTNNDFTQLIEFFMEIKEKMLNDDSSMTIRIHESVLQESVNGVHYIAYRSKEADKYIESDKFLKQTYGNRRDQYNGEIAVDGDNVVGYVFIGDKTDKGFINSLFVDSKYRKHGIATRLLNDAISKYGGYDLTVKKNNKIAIEMYKNKGFVFVGNGNSSSEYYMKLKSHLSNDEKKMVLGESYLIEDSIDSINKAFVDDFKKYINENPKGYNKEIKPLGTPITYTAKKKNEKWLLLATYNGELNKKTSSSFLPQLQKNVKYNGENIEYHTCYLPGDIYIFIKLPNGGR